MKFAKAAIFFSSLAMLAIVATALSLFAGSASAVSCDNDGVCDAGENPLWCANDCHPAGFCGDGFCDINEQGNCPADCGANCTPTNGGIERCDGADNDCDGKIDEGLPLICKSEPSSAALYIPDTASQSFKIIISNPNSDPLVIKWLDNGATSQTGNTSYIFSATPSSGSPHIIKATVNNTATDEYMEKEWQLNINTTYYRDADSDGYGNAADSVRAYAAPVGYVFNNTDCNDTNSNINPATIWYKDLDNDLYSDNSTQTQCIQPANYKLASELTATSGDCNDNNASINPGAAEVCDGVDNNCVGGIDEGVKTTYYRDADNDAYGDAGNSQQLCGASAGWILDNTDCNDTNSNINPATIWYKDLDNDLYSDNSTQTQCIQPANYKLASELTATSGDCDDNNVTINPGAAEICDGVDNNCVGGIDEGVKTTYYHDFDEDSYGDAGDSKQLCGASANWILDNTDCDDNNSSINPATIWYKDADNDLYSDGSTLTQCSQPANYKLASQLTATSGDCDDGNSAIKPGAAEVCDGADNNCNGLTDSTDSSIVLVACEKQIGVCAGSQHTAEQCVAGGWQSCTAANYGVSYGNELCDNLDNDCDALIDEGLDETKLIGSEFQITTDPNKDGYPAIAFGEDRYLLVWIGTIESGSRNIFGRFLAADGAPIGSQFAIAQYDATQSMAAVEYNKYAQKWLVVWTDYRVDTEPGFGDLYGRVVNSDGSFAGSEFVISAEYDAQEMGAIVSLPDKFLVAWTDSRAWENSTADVYAQFVATNGSLIGTEITISNGTDVEADPALAYDPVNDRILAVWEDWRNTETTGADTYGRFIGSNGSFIGSEFAIIAENYNQQFPDIAYNSKDRTFMVVTDEFMSPTIEQKNLRGQKLSANGAKIGLPFQFNDNPLGQWAMGDSAKMAYNPIIDKYLAVWEDNRTSADGALDTFAQIIKSDGSLEGNNFVVSNAPDSQGGARAASGPGQEFLVVWDDWRDGIQTDIWGQRVQGACG